MRHISIIAFILLSVSVRAQVHLTEILPDSQQLMIPVTDSLIQAEYYQVYKKLQIPHLFYKGDSICYTLYVGGDTSCVAVDTVYTENADTSICQATYGSDTLTLYRCLNGSVVDSIKVEIVGGGGADTDVDSLALSGYTLHVYEDDKDRTVDLTSLKDSIVAIADTCLQSLIVANGIGSDTLYLTYCDGTRKDTVVFYPPVLNDTSVCQVSYAGDTLTLYLCDTSGIIDSLKTAIIIDTDTDVDSLTFVNDTLHVFEDDKDRAVFLGSIRDTIPDYDFLVIGSNRVPDQIGDIDSSIYTGTTASKRVRIGQDSLENSAVLGVNGGVLPFQTWSSLSANQWRQFSRSSGYSWNYVQQSNDWYMQFLDTNTDPDSSGVYLLFQGGYFGTNPLISAQDGTIGFSQYPNTRIDGTVDSITALYYPGAAGDLNIAPIDSVMAALGIIGYNGLTNQSPDSIKLGGFLVEDTHIKGQETLDLTTGAGWKMNFDTLDRFNASANRRLELWTTRDQARGGIYNTYGYLILDALVGNQLLFRNYTDNLDGTFQITPDALEIRLGDTTSENQAIYGAITMTNAHVRIDAENQVGLDQVDTNYVMITQDSFGSIKWQDLHNLYAIDYDWIKLIGDTTMITAKFDTLLHDDSLDLYQLAYRPGIVRLGDTMFIKTAYDTSLFPGTYRAAYPAQLQIADRKNATDFHGDSSVYDWRSITKGDWSFRLHNQDNLTDSIPHWYEVGVSSWYRPDPASPGDTTYRQVFRISSQANENAIVLYQDSIRLADYDPASDIDSSITSTEIQALYVPQANGVMKMALLDTINAALSVAASTPDITMFERYNSQDSVALNLNSTIDTAFADLVWLRNSVSGDTLYQGSDYVYDFGVKDISISNDTIFQGSEFIVLPGDSLGTAFTDQRIIFGDGTRGGKTFANFTFDTATTSGTLNVPGWFYTGTDVGSSSAGVFIGYNRSLAGSAQFGLYADAGTTYSSQVFRNSGANGNLAVRNNGTGSILFQTNGTTNALTAKGTQQIQLNAYTSTAAFPGTQVGLLAFDASGNVLTETFDDIEASMGGPFQPAGSYDNYQYFTIAGQSGTPNGVFSTETLTINGGGIASSSVSGNTVTVTATEVDGSTSNEIQTLSTGTRTSSAYPITLSLGGGTVNIGNFTGTLNGMVPGTSGGSTTTFLRGDGTWATPSTGGGIYGGSGTIDAAGVTATVPTGVNLRFAWNSSAQVINIGTSGLYLTSTGGVKISSSTADDLLIDSYGGGARIGHEATSPGSRIGFDDDGDIHIIAQNGASDDIYIQSDLTSGTVDIDAGAGGVLIESLSFNSSTVENTGGSMTVESIVFSGSEIQTDIVIGDTPANQFQVSTTTGVCQINGETANSYMQFQTDGDIVVVSTVAGADMSIGAIDITHIGNVSGSVKLVSPDNGLGGTSTPSVECDVFGDIEYTGTITDVSDQRLKQNIKAIDNPYEKVMALKPVSFQMKKSPQVTEFGYIAQDYQKVFPDQVHDTGDGYLGIEYQPAATYTTAAVQQLIKDKEDLEKRVEKLEQLIKEIRK